MFVETYCSKLTEVMSTKTNDSYHLIDIFEMNTKSIPDTSIANVFVSMFMYPLFWFGV